MYLTWFFPLCLHIACVGILKVNLFLECWKSPQADCCLSLSDVVLVLLLVSIVSHGLGPPSLESVLPHSIASFPVSLRQLFFFLLNLVSFCLILFFLYSGNFHT